MKTEPKIKGSNPLRSRNRNRQAVLGQIRAAETMGRAEIGRNLGLSTQAVSNIIAELLSEGLIEERGARASGRGLPAVQYGIHSKGGYAFGVEIRPDVILTSLLDLSVRQCRRSEPFLRTARRTQSRNWSESSEKKC